MSFPWFIAFRYLTARRKQAFISLISLVLILGVGVGVMALIIATALMTGVQGEMRDRIVGATAHINVYKSGPEGLLDVEAEIAKMKVEGVIGVAPVILGPGMIQMAGRHEPVQLKGIDPAREVLVTDLAGAIQKGSLADLVAPPVVGPEEMPLNDPILLGIDLAEKLNASVDDDVQVMTPEGVLSPVGITPRFRLFTVVGIFKLGFYQVDANFGMIPLSIAQDFLSRPGPDAMQIKVASLEAAPEVSARLQAALGPAYVAEDWTQTNEALYSALWLEKVAIALTIGLIVMVAALNIVASLVLLVMEKSRDIGILRTMGAPAAAIRQIFLLQGLTIGAVGTAGGAILGVLVCWVCEKYELFSLPGDVYQVTYLRFEVVPADVITIVVSAMLVCLGATIYPSRRAAALDPAEALRYQ